MGLSVDQVEVDGPGSAPPRSPVAVDRTNASTAEEPTRLAGRARRINAALPRLARWAFSDAGAYMAYVFVGAWVCGRFWIDPFGRISGHLPTDNVWFYWLLTHSAHSVAHLENPLFSEQMNVPNGVNMMANTSMLGVFIPFSPITLLVGPQIAYILYLTLAMAASAGAAYYVLSRHLVKSRLAAFVGGVFFGFAPGIVHHANGQPNFVSNFLLPFIVLKVFKLHEPGRVVRNGVSLGLLVVWQVFINEELLLVTAMACAVAVTVYSVFRLREARRAAGVFVRSLLLAIGIAVPLLAYPLWFQFSGPQSYQGIPNAFSNWGEDVTAYFTFSRDTLAGTPEVERIIGQTEQNSWFGAPLIVVLVVIVLVTWRRSLTVRVTTVVAIVFALLALGSTVRFAGRLTAVPGPWRLFDGLPLVGYMIASRMVYVVVACVAIALALATDTIPKLQTQQFRVPVRVMWAAILAVAMVPLFPTPLPAGRALNVPAFIREEGWRPYVDDQHTLVTVPLPNNTIGLKSLLWQSLAAQEYRIPRGYFLGPAADGTGAYGPPGRPTQAVLDQVSRTGRAAVVTEEMRRAVIDDLRFWRASIVVMDANERQQETLWMTFNELTGVQPIYTRGVWVWDVRPLVDGVGR